MTLHEQEIYTDFEHTFSVQIDSIYDHHVCYHLVSDARRTGVMNAAVFEKLFTPEIPYVDVEELVLEEISIDQLPH